MTDKARMSRKDLKQPDEFLTLSRQAVTWGRGHQQIVIGAIIGVAALVAVLGIATAYSAAQRRDANADLARALAKLSSSDFAGATTELTAVSERWSGSKVAPIASLLAADSALREGEADKAITILTALQPATSSMPSYLQQQALVIWGTALETKQQWSDAAGKYKDASAIAGPYTGAAVVGEARTREQAGEADKARELYRQAYEQFPDLPGREFLATKFAS